MPQVPTELFIRACKEVIVKANQEWLGPLRIWRNIIFTSIPLWYRREYRCKNRT